MSLESLTELQKKLNRRRFDAHVVANRDEALLLAKQLINHDDSVSWGGSKTLEDIGLLDYLRQHHPTVIDRDLATSKEERFNLMRQALSCDYYLTSFNAISTDGHLINVDSVGNRTAAIAFGPRNILAIIGSNKICSTKKEALHRARHIAAPLNAIRCNENPHLRFTHKTPCLIDGECHDCMSPDCICSSIVELRMCKIPGRIKIILVNEPLGL